MLCFKCVQDEWLRVFMEVNLVVLFFYFCGCQANYRWRKRNPSIWDQGRCRRNVMQSSTRKVLLKYIKESEELCLAMEPVELIKRVREIEREAREEVETGQEKDAKQSAALDLISRLNNHRSYSDANNKKGVRSCYDEGKRVAETLMFDYHRQHGIGCKCSSSSRFPALPEEILRSKMGSPCEERC